MNVDLFFYSTRFNWGCGCVFFFFSKIHRSVANVGVLVKSRKIRAATILMMERKSVQICEDIVLFTRENSRVRIKLNNNIGLFVVFHHRVIVLVVVAAAVGGDGGGDITLSAYAFLSLRVAHSRPFDFRPCHVET